MHIRQPGESSDVAIELPQGPDDEDRYRTFVKKVHATAPNNPVLRVASVQWLGNECFLVRPAAESAGVPVNNTIGTFELFRRDGDSLGRYTVYCELDPANDFFFMRENVLVVIRGVMSAARAAYPGVLKSGAADGTAALEIDEVRIRAYELFSDVPRVR